MKQSALKLGVRLFAFALPHWRIVVFAVAGMAVFAATRALQLALVKPVFARMTEDPAGADREKDRLAADRAMAEGGDSKQEAKDPIKSLERRAQNWARRFAIVQKVEAWWAGVTETFLSIGLFAIGLAPVVFVSSFWHEYWREKVRWRVVVDIRNALCDRVLPYSLNFFENKRSGELISNLTNDILVVQKALIFLFGEIFLQPIQLVLFLTLALHYSWQLTVMTVVGAPVIIVPMRLLGKRVRRQSRGSLERLADLTDAMSQLFSGIRVVKAFKMEKEESEEFHGVNLRYFGKVMKLAKARALAGSVMDGIFVLAMAVFLIGGARVIARYELSAQDFAGCVVMVAAMAHPVRRLTKAYNTFQESLAAAERVFSLIDLDARLHDDPKAQAMAGFETGIEFRNVTFAYDSEPVLRDVSFFAPKGSIVAFVGESGAGKTTLLNLVPRFYDPVEGAIEIDGADVRKLTHDSLLDHLAIVTQQPFLFNRSIAENVRYGRRDADLDSVVAACKAANIHDFIAELPAGYETSVGEMGEKLSGGQRQRVTIARAILKDPSILILDEATSSLDSESEKLVQTALNNLMKGRTTLVIAHRLSTVQHADKIIVLKAGRIVEEGSHEELLAKAGEYGRLYDMQFAPVGGEDDKVTG